MHRPAASTGTVAREGYYPHSSVVSGGNSANLNWALHTHDVGRAAFGEAPVRTGSRTVRQAILALGRQCRDHLIVDVGDHPIAVGDEIGFGVGYGALVRAMTSPFVTKIEHLGRSGVPVPDADAGGT